jgi:hypothetical protein
MDVVVAVPTCGRWRRVAVIRDVPRPSMLQGTATSGNDEGPYADADESCALAVRTPFATL